MVYLTYYIIIPSQQEEFTAHKNVFFRILLFAIAVNVIAGTIKRFTFRIAQIGFVLTHLGLIIIIIGASISSFTSKRGLLMIDEGMVKNYFIIFKESPNVSREGKMPAFDRFLLPFSVKLIKFSIDYYYNSYIPSDYKSIVEIIDTSDNFTYEIRMNKPLKHKGFELFQSDFVLGSGNSGKNVSILSVNYDPGKNISFIGFIVLAVGVVNLFLLKNFWNNFELSLIKKIQERIEYKSNKKDFSNVK